MGIEDLRKTLEQKKRGVIPSQQSTYEKSNIPALENLIDAFKEIVVTPASVLTGSSNVRRELKQLHIFEPSVLSYSGPWAEEVIQYVMSMPQISAEQFARHFKISHSDALIWCGVLTNFSVFHENYENNDIYKKIANDDIKDLLDAFKYYLTLETWFETQRFDNPLDIALDMSFVQKITGYTYVDEAWIRKTFQVGYRRGEELLRLFDEMKLVDNSEQHMCYENAEKLLKIQQVNLRMKHWRCPFPNKSDATNWSYLFFGKFHNRYSKVLADKIHSKNSNKYWLARYFEMNGIACGDQFVEMVAHCVADDEQYFESITEQVYKQEFRSLSSMDDVVTALKKFGFVSPRARNRIHRYLSYDDAEILIKGYISEAKAEKQAHENNVYEKSKSNQKVLIDDLSGVEFEQYCKKLLLAHGFSHVDDTPKSGDRGIDLIAEKDDIRYVIQCKRYAGNVGNKAVQEAYSGKGIYNADVAVVMTNSHFTAQAIEDAKRLRVKLWDGDYIAKTFMK